MSQTILKNHLLRLSHFCLLLLAAISSAQAEQSLQLSAELTSPPAMVKPMNVLQSSPSTMPVIPRTPSVLTISPSPSQEVKDDLPPIPTIDLTTPPDDLWQRMRNGFAMANLDSPLVADRQAWYLNHPEGLKRVFERSRRYLHHIVGELEKRGMPTELALLPIVESSYNPMAYSSARALGMWQFIPSTGKNYNLKQNWWYDQRRDIIASTSAALDYLQNIYEMHGDWHLALASYNWGEGSVGRAIAKNTAKGLPTDYVHLTMPAETRYYVPKLQAIKNIIAEPELFGLRLDPIPNRPYFGVVERQGNMDIALAARLAEIPVDEFIALNPAYSRPVMPDTSKSPLVLPANKVQTYLDNLESHEAKDKPLSAWLTHQLKKGEKIDSVANRYGINPAQLRKLNGINARTKVTPGFTLLIPGKDAIGFDSLAGRLPQTPAEPPRVTKDKKAGKVVGKRVPRASGKKHGSVNVKIRNPSGKIAPKPKNKPAAKR